MTSVWLTTYILNVVCILLLADDVGYTHDPVTPSGDPMTSHDERYS